MENGELDFRGSRTIEVTGKEGGTHNFGKRGTQLAWARGHGEVLKFIGKDRGASSVQGNSNFGEWYGSVGLGGYVERAGRKDAIRRKWGGVIHSLDGEGWGG